MRWLRFGLVLALSSFALVPADWAGPSGDAAKGKQLFMRDGCYACHGTQGAGGGIAGPALVQNLPPFEAVLMQLRDPANRMPPYADKVLSNSEAEDIYAYLTSLPPDHPAEQIPLLNLMPAPKRAASGGGPDRARHSAAHAER